MRSFRINYLALLACVFLDSTSAFVSPVSNGLFVQGTIDRSFERSKNEFYMATSVGESMEDRTAEPPTIAVNVPSTTREANFLQSYPSLARRAKTTITIEGILEEYSRLTKEHYLVMAFLQAAFLASIADITTQTLEGATLDFGHTAAMATVASTMSGVMNAIWLRQLEQAFPGTQTKAVAAKTLIHAIIIASIINSAYLVGVPLFSDYFFGSNGFSLPPMDLSVLRGGWTLDEFITLTKLEVLMFIPYNTIAFKFIPPSFRPLTHAAISATFNIAVSAITLGYFDIWCHRAASMFS